MSWNKAISFYLLGTIGQIWLICIIVLILRNLGMVVDIRHRLEWLQLELVVFHLHYGEPLLQ